MEAIQPLTEGTSSQFSVFQQGLPTIHQISHVKDFDDVRKGLEYETSLLHTLSFRYCAGQNPDFMTDWSVLQVTFQSDGTKGGLGFICQAVCSKFGENPNEDQVQDVPSKRDMMEYANTLECGNKFDVSTLSQGQRVKFMSHPEFKISNYPDKFDCKYQIKVSLEQSALVRSAWNDAWNQIGLSQLSERFSMSGNACPMYGFWAHHTKCHQGCLPIRGRLSQFQWWTQSYHG